MDKFIVHVFRAIRIIKFFRDTYTKGQYTFGLPNRSIPIIEDYRQLTETKPRQTLESTAVLFCVFVSFFKLLAALLIAPLQQEKRKAKYRLTELTQIHIYSQILI